MAQMIQSSENVEQNLLNCIVGVAVRLPSGQQGGGGVRRSHTAPPQAAALHMSRIPAARRKTINWAALILTESCRSQDQGKSWRNFQHALFFLFFPSFVWTLGRSQHELCIDETPCWVMGCFSGSIWLLLSLTWETCRYRQ